MLRPILSLLIAFVMQLAVLSSCGAAQPRSWDKNARIGVNLTGHGLVLADSLLAERFRHAVEGVDNERYVQIERDYRPALATLEVTDRSLRVAESSLDLYERHQTDDPCLARRDLEFALANVSNLRGIFQALSLDAPADLMRGAEELAPVIRLLGPRCAAQRDGGTEERPPEHG